jgi:transitional endoplasmic reticulum ATPase
LSPGTRLPELPWEAFAHLGEQAEMAARLLTAALTNRELGVGILLYGPPGTGKTSFAATLASKVGATLYPVGEADPDGLEPSRRDRLSELQLNQRLLGNAASVLLFDEAEDLFDDRRARRSKVFLHRQLEDGRAPVIWTANDVDAIGPAMARRMMMCIDVRQPSETMRADLWSNMAKLEAISLSLEDAAELARIVPAAPAIMRNAMRATRLVGGGSDTARMVGTGIAQAVAGGRLPPLQPTTIENYDPMLIQADCDLVKLVQQLTKPGATRAVSLLLSGPPGSGKSAFARHLAVAMKLPVLQKRASDLISPYVGQSEQQIAAAFAEATDPGAFLIFDEADSLLADRRDAHRGWEVSQVNEMLTWMESHQQPFVCTTNLLDKLDQASMRRFLFKVRFGYLTQAQNRLAFARFFQMSAPSTIDGVQNLTPSDFALVRRRASLLGKDAQPDTLLAMLKSEAAGRGEARSIGFISRN